MSRLLAAPGQETARATIAALFDVPVGVGVTNPQDPQPAPMEGEAAHLDRALPGRKAEFAAGRAAARAAMAEIGLCPQAVPSHADRAPIWPDGMTGSISHKSMLCAAVVTQAPVSLGLDIEQNTDLDATLCPTICSAAERAAIAGPDQGRLAKLIFSAKEAAYKAQYPITREIFGFDVIRIVLDLPSAAFTAHFEKPVGPFRTGDTLPGRFATVEGHLVTAALTRQFAPKGT